jgi:putative methionine-R-sulfoxide reductase with GAF domain
MAAKTNPKVRLYAPLNSSAMQRFVTAPSHHLRKVLIDILDQAMKPVGVQHGWIALINPAAKELHIVAHRGVAKEYQKKRLKIGKEGVPEWVAMEGRLLNIQDVSKDPRSFNLIKSTRSEICVPLLSNKVVLGVINLESDSLGAFTTQEEQHFGSKVLL